MRAAERKTDAAKCAAMRCDVFAYADVRCETQCAMCVCVVLTFNGARCADAEMHAQSHVNNTSSRVCDMSIFANMFVCNAY